MLKTCRSRRSPWQRPPGLSGSRRHPASTVTGQFRSALVLQNVMHWVKSIARSTRPMLDRIMWGRSGFAVFSSRLRQFCQRDPICLLRIASIREEDDQASHEPVSFLRSITHVAISKLQVIGQRQGRIESR